jgi:deazaflavin-dependent oxidoreductase (nitroreductase family)
VSRGLARLRRQLDRRSTKIHAERYHRSGGRLASRLPGWRDARILLVDHIGAKSGTKRTSPVIYHQHGDALAVVGSKAGQPTNPAWFHNLPRHHDPYRRRGSRRPRAPRHQRKRAAVAAARRHFPRIRPLPAQLQRTEAADGDPRPSLAPAATITRARHQEVARSVGTHPHIHEAGVSRTGAPDTCCGRALSASTDGSAHARFRQRLPQCGRRRAPRPVVVRSGRLVCAM